MAELFDSLNLNKSIIKALNKASITIPTEIQSKVIPYALDNKDIIAESETGTGKALAYLLPVFEKINTQIREMQAIILAPTHELVIQIIRQIEMLSENSDLKVTTTPIIGNVNIDRQIDKLKEKPHIKVGSPGRILELIKKKKITAHLVKTIVIDEADRMLDENNIDNVKAIIKSTLKDRQILLFSASISKNTIVAAKEFMKEPELIKGVENVFVPEAIEHLYFICDNRDKVEVLRKLVRILNPSKALVFVNKGDEIELLTEKLIYHKLKAGCIHGSNIKLDRKKTMDDFRNGKLQLLVASDIAARGLDIEDVTHIINFTLPEEAKEYLHRVGRTGRKGKSGVAISIVNEKEKSLLTMYENTLKIKIMKKGIKMGDII